MYPLDQIILSLPRALGLGPSTTFSIYSAFLFFQEKLQGGKVRKKKKVNSKFPKSQEKVKGVKFSCGGEIMRLKCGVDFQLWGGE